MKKLLMSAAAASTATTVVCLRTFERLCASNCESFKVVMSLSLFCYAYFCVILVSNESSFFALVERTIEWIFERVNCILQQI
jgi:hypothetical protein